MATTADSATSSSVSPANDHGHAHGAPNARQLPVTVITGFLGAGKTTLLQYILNNKAHGMRVAVINNEFVASNMVKLGVSAEMGELKEAAADTIVAQADIYETNSGCLCCGGGAADFMKILWELSNHKDKIDYVLVETTGLADPTFTNAFFIDERLKAHFYLDGIVTLVDAANAHFELTRAITPSASVDKGMMVLHEFREQIAIADRLVINKMDLINNEQMVALEQRIRDINPSAPITRTEYSRVGDLTPFLAAKSFDLTKTLARDKNFLDDRSNRVHDSSIQSVCLMGPGYLPRASFQSWLKATLAAYPREILRCKGCVALSDSPDVHVFQGVHDLLDITARAGVKASGPHASEAVAPDGSDQDINRFVFIVRQAPNDFGETLLASFNHAVNGDSKDGKVKGKAAGDRVNLRLLLGEEEPPAPALMKVILVLAALLVLVNSKLGASFIEWVHQFPIFNIGVFALMVLVAFLIIGKVRHDRAFEAQLAATRRQQQFASCPPTKAT